MAPRPTEFHPEALDESIAAKEWYRQIDDTLAAAFRAELDQAIQRIAAAPNRWAAHLHGTRGYLLRRFPFIVVYRVHQDRIQVIAVQHAKRKPGYWRRRMGN